MFFILAFKPSINSNGKMIEQEEIFYHIFQRSFFDSNGDSHGDLKGVEHKLDYLEALGVTSIILLPLYESPYYHNYFASNFRAIDKRYGDLEDLIRLVNAVHDRGMRIYLDMEIHYVTEDHLWFKDSFGNPDSEYSDYIIYNDEAQTIPESIIFNLEYLESYDGVKKRLMTINLLNEKVKKAIYDEFRFWLDPLQDDSGRSGVDGFRIDHMMDDLDLKGILPDLLSEFWRPLFENLREMKPSVKFIGEQGDWLSYGEEYFEKARIDYMFAFNLKAAITELNKDAIIHHARNMVAAENGMGEQILFIENHDTNRFASDVENEKDKLKVGAALNLLLRGAPCIYYGQELGMLGKGGFGAYGLTDGNDIPRREAMPWYASLVGEGMSFWYKDSGPWWEDSALSPFDGISVEEQFGDPQSLFHFYKDLIALRKRNQPVGKGEIHFIDTRENPILAFTRSFGNEQILVLINLHHEQIDLPVDLKFAQTLKADQILFHYKQPGQSAEGLLTSIAGYGIIVAPVHEE